MGDHAAENAAAAGRIIRNPGTRRWLYGIVAAVIGLLQLYGLLDGQQAQGWADLATAVLALGTIALAIPNTPKE